MTEYRKKRNIAGKRFKLLISLLIMICLCGCTTSLAYSETASEGPWEASIYPEGREAFVTSYVWDGTEEGLRLDPRTVSGCTVTRYGGYFGRGLPEPFFIIIPNSLYINEADIPEDAVVQDLEFTLVVNAMISDIFCRNLEGYFVAEEDDGSLSYYRLLINAELDPNNRSFHIVDGKLCEKGSDTPVPGIYYEPEDTSISEDSVSGANVSDRSVSGGSVSSD